MNILSTRSVEESRITYDEIMKINEATVTKENILYVFKHEFEYKIILEDYGIEIPD